MKIALVIASLGPGGAERVLVRLARAWAERGREVLIVTLSDGRDDHYAVPPGTQRIALGVLAASSTLFEAATRNLGRLVRVRDAIAGWRPDVVVGFGDTTNVLVILAMLGTRIPVIVSERTDPRRPRIDAAWSRLRRLAYPLASALVMQTEATRTWAEQHVGRARTHVIPNPVEPPGAAIDTPRQKRVLAVGRLRPEKGFDLLLPAFAACARERPDWSLVLLGDGPERDRLESLAHELGIAHRTSFAGVVAEPADWLSSASIFALSSRCEGFPNALLEAMSHGVAVVAANCPSGPGEIVSDGVDGLLVPPEDSGALAAAMRRLMDAPALREALGRRAREAMKRYELGAIVERWDHLLKQVVGARGGAAR